GIVLFNRRSSNTRRTATLPTSQGEEATLQLGGRTTLAPEVASAELLEVGSAARAHCRMAAANDSRRTVTMASAILLLLSGVGAFLLGSTDATRRLLAQCGSAGCLGGCQYVASDGHYIDLDVCDKAEMNVFLMSQAVLAKDPWSVVAGPNCSPEQYDPYVPNYTDDSWDLELDCNTLFLQVSPDYPGLNDFQEIPMTFC